MKGRQGVIVGTSLALAACSSATTGGPPQLTSHKEQSDPRLVGEATSEGLNLCYKLVDAGTIEQPEPEWGATLDSFANALEAVQLGRVRSDMHARPEDVERARQLATLVKQWHDTDRRDDTIAKLALQLISAFNPE